jgi:xanthine dehydrogenase iron-sulfur cluster and FAD-binding subunit A
MCGFCTPGLVMAAVALAEKNPKPSREEACNALDGNICRCGTYVKVLAAVMGAPAVRASLDGPPDDRAERGRGVEGVGGGAPTQGSEEVRRG